MIIVYGAHSFEILGAMHIRHMVANVLESDVMFQLMPVAHPKCHRVGVHRTLEIGCILTHLTYHHRKVPLYILTTCLRIVCVHALSLVN